MYAKLRRLIVRQLGPSPSNGNQDRLVQLELAPAESSQANHSGYRSVGIVFRLYDNPLGRSWRRRTAEADVFEVMKAVFTSQLPIYSVTMNGIFPLPHGKKLEDQTALRAYIDHPTAARIPWGKWQRNPDTETRLWRLLSSKYIAPGFG
jgi:hypothetical protein